MPLLLPSRRRPLSLLAPALLGAVLLALVPGPGSAQAAGEAGEPRIVPMDVQPVLKNGAVAERLLTRFYPALLRDAGIEGVVGVWIRIDELGRVTETRLQETSGYVAFDDAAQQVAGTMSFEPARREGAAIPVWVPMNIAFRLPAEEAPAARPEPEPEAQSPPEPEPEAQVVEAAAAAPETTAPTPPAGKGKARPDSAAAAPSPLGPPPGTEPAPGDEAVMEEIAPPPAPAGSSLADSPTFTPMTVRPELQNAEEVQAALLAQYPPLLRDAGIGGQTKVWLFIDTDGRVERARVNETSGYDAMDEAALRVAETMRFSPARNRDAVVPVWLALTITFEAQ